MTTRRDVRGLLLDWGGVLTAPFHPTLRRWAAQEGLDADIVVAVVSRLLDDPDPGTAASNPLQALERGEIPVPVAERALVEVMASHGAGLARPDGILGRLFADGVVPDDTLLDVARRARANGLRTGVVSNSWGNSYPTDRWGDAIDIVVVSGEVGVRKPDPAMFSIALRLLEVEATECVLVDDELVNVRAAQRLGIIALHCRDVHETAARLTALLALEES